MIILLLLMAAIGTRGYHAAHNRSLWRILPLVLLGFMFFSPMLGVGLLLVRLIFRIFVILFVVRLAAAVLAGH